MRRRGRVHRACDHAGTVSTIGAAKSVRCLAEERKQMIWGEGALDAFEHVGWGGILIDAEGGVIGLNKEAQRHVGREVTLTNGQVTATHRSANTELQRLIDEALSADSGTSLATRGTVLLPRADGSPLMAYVMTIAAAGGNGAQSAKAMIVLVDTEKRREPTESVLRHAFGLTPAEARIAIAFAGGRDFQEIADDQGVNIGTVRKYFKSVLAKTNTSRQAELAILLARLAQRPKDRLAPQPSPEPHPMPETPPERCQKRGTAAVDG
jgi:DNA-binding CsgD family transcriptional regulator